MALSSDLARHLSEITIDAGKWQFADVRVDIPAASFGSDAINPHTQYSNPIAMLHGPDAHGIGAAFTLGRGNEMICSAAASIVSELNGASVADIMATPRGFYETLTNPLQLRWLSPNSGVPLMAAGLVMNTLIDAAAKSSELPAWEFLARLPSDFLLSLMNLRHLDERFQRPQVLAVLDRGRVDIDARCSELKATGIPVYFTTWIGHSTDQIAQQIRTEFAARGIRRFKIKIGPDFAEDSAKLTQIRALVPKEAELCVDANQTLTLDQAKQWLEYLSAQGFAWLEEPFAPDNVALFSALVAFKRTHELSCEVVTGENCPNHFTAAMLMDAGIDRFQADPCRMFGMVDALLVSILGRLTDCPVTPHAGGSSLDELSPHIQLLNLARVSTDLKATDTLTENVGFCSQFFAAPTVVHAGLAATPTVPGLLVGLAPALTQRIRDYREGITWLAL